MPETETPEEQQQEKEFINAFTKRVLKEKSGNYRVLKKSIDGRVVYPQAVGITSNRGNKLLQRSENVTRLHLDSKKVDEEEVVFYNGSEHPLLQRSIRKPSVGKTSGDRQKEEAQEVEEEDGRYVDLNNLVNVTETLSPIASLADIALNENGKTHSFHDNVLNKLALYVILMIEKEQNSLIRYSRLLELLLGEPPVPLYENNLGLKPYDHNLSLPDEEGQDTTNSNDKNVPTTELSNGTTEHSILPQPGTELPLSLIHILSSFEVLNT